MKEKNELTPFLLFYQDSRILARFIYESNKEKGKFFEKKSKVETTIGEEKQQKSSLKAFVEEVLKFRYENEILMKGEEQKLLQSCNEMDRKI
ncbi:MAG: hypothetical protein HC831_28595 [Chloroflexia bacterium]|nr:hypothetical protein [Chloroflexia bacterium]